MPKLYKCEVINTCQCSACIHMEVLTPKISMMYVSVKTMCRHHGCMLYMHMITYTWLMAHALYINKHLLFSEQDLSKLRLCVSEFNLLEDVPQRANMHLENLVLYTYNALDLVTGCIFTTRGLRCAQIWTHIYLGWGFIYIQCPRFGDWVHEGYDVHRYGHTYTWDLWRIGIYIHTVP